MKKVLAILFLLLAAVSMPLKASAEEAQEGKPDLKGIIFHHLGDVYGWEVPFSHDKRIPLPIIVIDNTGNWHIFSSNKLNDGAVVTDGNAQFKIAHGGDYNGKIVQVLPNGAIDRPWDFSITKNVAALFVTALLLCIVAFSLVRFYKKKGNKAPKKGLGFFEMLVSFIYDGVIKNALGAKAPKFAGYLLTVFFFVFFMNLLGLIVVFPGGANLTGNIAITLVLALCTFIITNVKGNKHYWKDIFWPDVPVWLKFPLPIMPMIELFGIFTKPAALCVRLFANMIGGHMIVLVFTLLIFIFTAYGIAVTATTTVVSVAFSLFMLLLDVLVSFIQAYVFTMLSTLFISLAVNEEHGEELAKN